MSETTSVTHRDTRAANPPAHTTEALLPPVDVLEDANGITLYADLPGVDKDRLDLRVDGDTLVIEGEANVPLPDGLQANYAEVTLPRYRRSFTLSRDMGRDNITAELKHGVLKLRIPKADHAQPRKIAVVAS